MLVLQTCRLMVVIISVKQRNVPFCVHAHTCTHLSACFPLLLDNISILFTVFFLSLGNAVSMIVSIRQFHVPMASSCPLCSSLSHLEGMQKCRSVQD